MVAVMKMNQGRGSPHPHMHLPGDHHHHQQEDELPTMAMDIRHQQRSIHQQQRINNIVELCKQAKASVLPPIHTLPGRAEFRKWTLAAAFVLHLLIMVVAAVQIITKAIPVRTKTEKRCYG